MLPGAFRARYDRHIDEGAIPLKPGVTTLLDLLEKEPDPARRAIGMALEIFGNVNIDHFAPRREVVTRPLVSYSKLAIVPDTDAPLARTWRAAGWIPGQPALTTSGERLERIEQAIDAIAVELDRVGRQQLAWPCGASSL